jgi:hypothetical protein
MNPFQYLSITLDIMTPVEHFKREVDLKSRDVLLDAASHRLTTQIEQKHQGIWAVSRFAEVVQTETI